MNDRSCEQTGTIVTSTLMALMHISKLNKCLGKHEQFNIIYKGKLIKKGNDVEKIEAV